MHAHCATLKIKQGPDVLIVEAPLQFFLTFHRIGGRFDSASGTWIFPARRSTLASILALTPLIEDRDHWMSLCLGNVSAHLLEKDSKPSAAGDQAHNAHNAHIIRTQAEVSEAPRAIPDPAPVPAPVVPAGPPPLKALEPIPVVKTEPWRHQLEAYWFVMRCFAKGRRGVLLALEMGCGKSKVTIDTVQNLKGCRTVLIVCPARVIQVWPGQFAAHAAKDFHLVPLTSKHTVAKKVEIAKEQIALAAALGRIAVIIINYESVWREEFAEFSLLTQWDLVVLDEVHRAKAPGGKISKYLKRLGRVARHRLGLTGTPMPHSPLDVYAQFRFLDLSVFGPSFNAFRSTFATMGGFQDREVVAYRNLDLLESKMREITFRTTKDVLNLIPPTYASYDCPMSPGGRKVYEDLERDLIAGVKDGTVTAANALVKLLRLQQITGGWIKLDDGRIERVCDAKQKLLEDVLEDIGRDEPVVVFCRFHTDLDNCHAAATSLGIQSLELSGRRDQLAQWAGGAAQLLAVQIDAGGVGVDLTRARYSIFYSLTFSLAAYDQAQSRVHRPGQTRAVTHINLAVERSIDARIVRALAKRAEVIGEILREIGGSV